MALRALVAACLLALPATAAAGAEGEAAMPRIQVVLQRTSIHPGNEVPIEVRLVNPLAVDLTEVKLSVAVPAFLTIAHPDCRAAAVRGLLDLGGIKARSARHETLCLRAREAVVEGEFNLAFAMEYTWRTPTNAVASGYALDEHKLTASLFGTESVAGVPLSLLAYVVPGALVLVLLRILGIPRLEKITNTEASVLIVVFSVFTGSLFATRAGQAVSAVGFFVLCLRSVGLALVLSLFPIWRMVQQARRRRLLVRRTDGHLEGLAKALAQALPPGPVRVTLRNGQVLWASMSAKADGGIALFGWYTVTAGDYRQQLEALLIKRRFSKVLVFAREKHLTLDMANGVQERLQETGALSPIDEPFKVISSEDVVDGPIQEAHDDLDAEPIVIEPSNELPAP